MELLTIIKGGLVGLGVFMSGAAISQVISGAAMASVAAGILVALVGIFVATLVA